MIYSLYLQLVEKFLTGINIYCHEEVLFHSAKNATDDTAKVYINLS
jgi:hypothetical protein